ncbi:aldehyde dehydrogenase family protein [Sulfobacillus harzensis]|uniref:Aldehyde dehydrogenase n=1 Tax=Sulfobacillus harzensis TaxID=2729629 RepID=A0A7Y0Q1U1_9FIRM|nr:aldehyde dehydrogenase family protein [Sulfobacillus harzensis]NMP22458.1 aldehyde dehydrogenase [Sulfobacillus harzensis]
MERWGAWIEGSGVSGNFWSPIVNPATEEVEAEVADLTAADVDRAIAIARRAGRDWRARDVKERHALLMRWVEHLASQAEDLAQLECRQTGQPISLARQSIAAGIRLLQQCASAVQPEVSPGLLRRRPREVAAAALPGRYPFLEAIYYAAPALAAGSAVVLKPASHAPLTPLRLAAVASLAGIPGGALNLLSGPDSVVMARLSEHVSADLVVYPAGPRAFGKGAMLVFADADCDAAVEGAINAAFVNGGQDLLGASRIFVEDALFGPFMDQLVGLADQLLVGAPTSAEAEIGPLASRRHREELVQQVMECVEMGAQTALGGQRYSRRQFPQGYYYPPTVLFHTDISWPIVERGVFGPVVTVMSFSGLDQALGLLGQLETPAAVSVWTRDGKRLGAIASAVPAPLVTLNRHLTSVPAARLLASDASLGRAHLDRFRPWQAVGDGEREGSEQEWRIFTRREL